MRSSWSLVVVAVLTLAPIGPARARDPDHTFAEFVEAFEAGRLDVAERRLTELLEAPLDPTQARLYCDEAPFRFWVHVVARPEHPLSRLWRRVRWRAAAEVEVGLAERLPRKVCGLAPWR